MRLLVAVLAALLVTSCGVLDDVDDTASGNDTGPVAQKRDDSCEIEAEEDEDYRYLTVYRIAGGEMLSLCCGDDNLVLNDAWGILEAFTDDDDRKPISKLAGFVDGAEGESYTVAYVFPLDNNADEWRMSVNVEAAEANYDDFVLTMAHEFAHILTTRPGQIDAAADEYDCVGFFDGNFCNVPGSWLDEWVEEFWAGSYPEALSSGVDEAAGEERCAYDGAFLGSYAASHPAEDFAETFSAFVFDIPVSVEMGEKMQFFAERPELAVFRDRAAASEINGISDPFEGCGAG